MWLWFHKYTLMLTLIIKSPTPPGGASHCRKLSSTGWIPTKTCLNIPELWSSMVWIYQLGKSSSPLKPKQLPILTPVFPWWGLVEDEISWLKNLWPCCSHDQQFSRSSWFRWFLSLDFCPRSVSSWGPARPAHRGGAGPYISSCWTAESTSCAFDHDRWRMMWVPKIWRLKQKHLKAKVWAVLREYFCFRTLMKSNWWCGSRTSTHGDAWWWNETTVVFTFDLLTCWKQKKKN